MSDVLRIQNSMDVNDIFAREKVSRPKTVGLNEREVEHFTRCLKCVELWSIFYHTRKEAGRSNKEMADEWSSKSSTDRAKLLLQLKKSLKDRLIPFTKKATIGYTLFVQERNRTLKTNMKKKDMRNITKIIAAEWKALSKSDQNELNKRAQLNKEKMCEQRKNLSPFLKKRLRIMKKEKREKKNNRRKKIPNLYLIMLNCRWAEERAKNPKLIRTKFISTLFKEEWKNATDESKEKYVNMIEIEKNKRQEEDIIDSNRKRKRKELEDAALQIKDKRSRV